MVKRSILSSTRSLSEELGALGDLKAGVVMSFVNGKDAIFIVLAV
jgi:hypothetical protein